MKTWSLFIGLAIIAIAQISYLSYYYCANSVKNDNQITPIIEFVKSSKSELTINAVFDVRACKVIDGYRFAMFLEGNKWIEAHLSVATKEEATQVVIDWLNGTIQSTPTIKLLRNCGSYWIVEFRLSIEGKESNIIDSLRSKNLLLE